MFLKIKLNIKYIKYMDITIYLYNLFTWISFSMKAAQEQRATTSFIWVFITYVYIFVCKLLSIYLSIFLSIYLSINILISLSIYLDFIFHQGSPKTKGYSIRYMSIHHIYIYSSIYISLSIHISIYLDFILHEGGPRA